VSISKTLEYIEKNAKSGEPILAVPDIPIFYFLSGHPNPTRFELFRPGRFPDTKTQVKVVEDIASAGVNLVILNLNQVDDGMKSRRLSAHAPVIANYLKNNFVPVDRYGPFLILERSEPTVRARNFILITIDTLRFDHLEPYGYRFHTSPCMMELAGESIKFQRAYTPVPKTRPALASLMTGEYPGKTGVFYNGDLLDRKNFTIAEALHDKEFCTIAVVSNPLLTRGSGFAQGFDRFDDCLDPPVSPAKFMERNASKTTNRAITLIDSAAASGQRFFAWIEERGEKARQA
jgi:hypothetical protein